MFPTDSQGIPTLWFPFIPRFIMVYLHPRHQRDTAHSAGNLCTSTFQILSNTPRLRLADSAMFSQIPMQLFVHFARRHVQSHLCCSKNSYSIAEYEFYDHLVWVSNGSKLDILAISNWYLYISIGVTDSGSPIFQNPGSTSAEGPRSARRHL